MLDEEKYKDHGIDNIGMGNGITITTGFDVSAQLPLDARTVVKTIADLHAMPAEYVYMGLLVYVLEDNKLYQWKEVLQEDRTYKIGWGPIEAEVSAVELEHFKEHPAGEEDLWKITEEIDFENTPVLMMQKNKENFFPIVHEDYIYVGKEGDTLISKYQPRIDETLIGIDSNGDGSVVGAIGSLNTKMDDTIAEFREEITNTLNQLKNDVKKMQDDTQKTMDQLKADTEADFEVVKQEMQDDLAEMNRLFDEKMDEINDQMDILASQIESRVDQMLKDVDNSIMSDADVADFMRQINANLDAIDGNSTIAITASFETYSSVVRVDTAVSEVSIAGLGVTVNSRDKLFVHVNSVYLIEDVDYRLDTSAQKIICLTGTWNSYNIPGCEFSFDLIKKVNIGDSSVDGPSVDSSSIDEINNIINLL